MRGFCVFSVFFFFATVGASSFHHVSDSDNSQHWVFTQSISHFADIGTFSQRVFIRPSVKVSAPIYLEICGEQSCNDYFPELIDQAVQRQAGHIVAIEHRYYGESQPFANLENLKYLNTREALADVKKIIGELRSSLNMSGPLILFGCSYAGNLAAYLKSEFPELAVGAIAVSAPIRPQLFIPEKDEFNTAVLGECAPKLRQSLRIFEKVLMAMSEEDFAKTLKILHFKTQVSKESVIELLGDLPSYWVSAKKYRVFCSRLSDNPNDLGPLLEAFARYIEFSNKDKDTFERAEMTDTQQDTRQWLYQTCSEYGYFQISSREGVGPIGKNKEFKRDMCKRLFGISVAESTPIQEYYQRVLQKGRNIAFSNARDDFWSTLSLTESPRRGLDSIAVESGGHCSAYSDFKNGKPGEQAEFLLSKISDWLSQKQKKSR